MAAENPSENPFVRPHLLTDNIYNTQLRAVLTDISPDRLTENADREVLIQGAIDNEEAVLSDSGALAYESAPDCGGRSPNSTYYVDGDEKIDPSSNMMARGAFDEIWGHAMERIKSDAGELHMLDRQLGADPDHAMPVTVITNRNVSALFADTMLLPRGEGVEKSKLHDKGMTMVVLPWDRIELGALSDGARAALTNRDGTVNNKAVIMDTVNNVALVFGDSYNGPIKKTPYTMHNRAVTKLGVLPMHCSANVGPDGRSAIFFGLSGTGKTTLSTDPSRPLAGDDEHGWGDGKVWNLEAGCYAKTLGITEESEPDIFKAATQTRGAIVENVPLLEDGTFDFSTGSPKDPDGEPSANGRVAYRLEDLKAAGGQVGEQVIPEPDNIVFLAMDATGVLPPISQLTEKQIKEFFALGYTAKVAGTEAGVREPAITLSPCFGKPFLPEIPETYVRLLMEKLEAKPDTKVWLVNTGMNGTGKRMRLSDTRTMLNAAISGELDDVDYVDDPHFGVRVPVSCPGISDPDILIQSNSWADPREYDTKALALKAMFEAKLAS